MTTPIPVLDKPAAAAIAPACPACGHPSTAHDAIGLRYCAATTSGALTRGCICSGLDPAAL